MSVEITLSTPITAHGETITTITVRRPKAKEMRDLPINRSGAKLGDFYDIAAACADLPPSSFEQLDGADVMKVVGVVGDFLGGGTGETPLS